MAAHQFDFTDLLRPGFIFLPTARELVECFLIRKILGRPLPLYPFQQLDIYRHNPKNLILGMSHENDAFGSQMWDYFFGERRPDDSDRDVPGGYWKVKNRGEEEEVVGAGYRVIGYKKDLVFCIGEDGVETQFFMEEYRVNPEVIDQIKKPGQGKNENLVACKIYEVLCLPWQNDDNDDIMYYDGDEEIDDEEKIDDGDGEEIDDGESSKSKARTNARGLAP